MPAEIYHQPRRSDAAGVAEFLAVVLDAYCGEMLTPGSDVRSHGLGVSRREGI